MGRAFGRPSGVLGRLGGRLMARGNGPTERHVVALADPRPGETVLVVGPGPGIGVRAAAVAGHVVAVDPSPEMLAACRRRCADLLDRGALCLALVAGDAARTGRPDAEADVAISVNNVMIWPDRSAGFAEVARVLRPGGRLLVSAHERWLDGGAARLAADARAAGFVDVETWTWTPPGRGASAAIQMRATRPPAGSGAA